MNLIPVKIRILHTNNWFHISKFFQKPLHLIVFLLKLRRIGHSLILASPAFLRIWTGLLYISFLLQSDLDVDRSAEFTEAGKICIV